MKLKTITLIAAIAHSVACLASLGNTVRIFKDVRFEMNPWLFFMQPVFLLSEITLVIFLFALVARQKS